jgi:F420-0:gamma-glutamyl ligase
VLADKVIALSEGRVGPPEILSDPDPKTVGQTQREQLATHWSEVCGFAVDDLHLLLADEYEASDGSRRSVLGTEDHNTAAYAVAREIAQITGQQVDVVISDTDTGLDVLRPLIGTVTIGATPLGATSGVTLYEAMRCACAAEFTRGHGRRIPIVICKPAQRCRARPHIGEFRGYSGALSANREPTLTYG